MCASHTTPCIFPRVSATITNRRPLHDLAIKAALQHLTYVRAADFSCSIGVQNYILCVSPSGERRVMSNYCWPLIINAFFFALKHTTHHLSAHTVKSGQENADLIAQSFNFNDFYAMRAIIRNTKLLKIKISFMEIIQI